MDKYLIFLILIFICIFFSCDNNPNSVIIKGVIKGFEGETLYAKKIDPFSFNSNSIIDSVKVDDDGVFEFIIDESSPILLNFSKHNNQHPVNQVLRTSPENYYFGYCAMFYIPEPTLYLTESSVIDLDWTIKNSLDSFAFSNLDFDYQNKFYNYYLKEDLSKGLYNEGGDFKIMEAKEAWGIIEQVIIEVLKKYDIQENKEKGGFDDYLYTEIKMGAINMYINWFEAIYEDELNIAFVSNEIPALYAEAHAVYSSNEWNHQSVEFYKMSERHITFELNKLNQKFQKYYSFNERKIKVLKKVLPVDLADKYIANN